MVVPPISDNPTIPLSPNSLYIATNQIMAQLGKFHWAFYLTSPSDTTNTATKFHWADLPTGSAKAEGLVIESVNPITTYHPQTGVVNFAFFLLSEIIVPPNSGKSALDILNEVTRDVFPAHHDNGYATIVENRKNGLTCRTWLLRAYTRLRDRGYIKRGESEREIEKIVAEKSTEIEVRAADGTFSMSEVMTI